MITTTSYGSWLPGDMRGYVQDGIILPGDPKRMQAAKARMQIRAPVLFSDEQQSRLFESLCNAANEFSYQLTDASVESWHLHWIIEHGFDSVPTMVGRLKNRMRQALAIGRIWTEGYHDSLLFDTADIETRRRYIRRHPGCRLSAGQLMTVLPRSVHQLPPLAPRSAGGGVWGGSMAAQYPNFPELFTPANRLIM